MADTPCAVSMPPSMGVGSTTRVETPSRAAAMAAEVPEVVPPITSTSTVRRVVPVQAENPMEAASAKAAAKRVVFMGRVAGVLFALFEYLPYLEQTSRYVEAPLPFPSLQR